MNREKELKKLKSALKSIQRAQGARVDAVYEQALKLLRNSLHVFVQNLESKYEEYQEDLEEYGGNNATLIEFIEHSENQLADLNVIWKRVDRNPDVAELTNLLDLTIRVMDGPGARRMVRGSVDKKLIANELVKIAKDLVSVSKRDLLKQAIGKAKYLTRDRKEVKYFFVLPGDDPENPQKAKGVEVSRKLYERSRLPDVTTKRQKKRITDWFIGDMKHATDRTANIDLLNEIVSQRDVAGLKRKADEQTYKLAVQVYMELKKRISLDNRESEALNRLKYSVNASDEGMIRNNIFKAADALGMKLPSSSF